MWIPLKPIGLFKILLDWNYLFMCVTLSFNMQILVIVLHSSILMAFRVWLIIVKVILYNSLPFSIPVKHTRIIFMSLITLILIRCYISLGWRWAHLFRLSVFCVIKATQLRLAQPFLAVINIRGSNSFIFALNVGNPIMLIINVIKFTPVNIEIFMKKRPY